MKDGFLQRTLDQIVVDGRPRNSQKESEFFPVSQQIGDRLTQTGVRFDFPLLELGIRPRAQLSITGSLCSWWKWRRPLGDRPCLRACSS